MLIQNEMQGGGQPQSQPQGQPQPEQRGAAPQVDPKLAQMYQRLGLSMMKVIYDKRITPNLMKMVRDSEDPVSGVVQASMTVVSQIAQRVKGVPPQAVVSILPATVALIFELADAAKLLKFTPDMLQQANAMIQQKMGGQPDATQEGAPAGQPAQELPAEAPATEQVEA